VVIGELTLARIVNFLITVPYYKYPYTLSWNERMILKTRAISRYSLILLSVVNRVRHIDIEPLRFGSQLDFHVQPWST
jgi:hypothetical protein